MQALFVIFAALPKEPESRYLVEISPEGVYIYKVKLATKMQY